MSTSTHNTKSETVDVNRIMMSPTLRPDEGVEYTGTMFHVEKGESEWGVYPIVFLNIEASEKHDVTGDVQFHCFHSIARQQFSKLRPAVGSPVSLVYLGKKESKNKGPDGDNRKYHDYRVWDPTADIEAREDLWDDEDDPEF